MKRPVFAALLATAALSATPPMARAQAPAAAPSAAPSAAPAPTTALQRIAMRGLVSVGYSENAPPFSLLDDKRQPVGYSIDICNAIVDRIRHETGKPDLKVRHVVVAPDQLTRVVASGGVDLMCGAVSDTAERRRTMAFSQPIFVSSVKLMVRAKDGITRPAELKGRPIVVLGRTTAEQAVTAYSDRNQLDWRLSRVASADAALSQLKLGQAGAWARDEILHIGTRSRLPNPADMVILPESLQNESIAIALPRDAGLQRAVDQGMALWVRAGKAEALYEQWFVRPNAASRAGLGLPMSAALKAEFDRLR